MAPILTPRITRICHLFYYCYLSSTNMLIFQPPHTLPNNMKAECDSYLQAHVSQMHSRDSQDWHTEYTLGQICCLMYKT